MNDELRSRCRGFTRTGTRCRNNARPGEKYCRTHLWQGRIKDTRRVEFWGLVVGVLALLFTIIDATTGVIGVLPSFRAEVTQVPQPTATVLAFPPAADDEVLIVVTQLDDRSDGKYAGIDPAQRIYNTILDKAKDQPRPPRVELLREVVADAQQARAKLKVYRATLLVWGWYDAIGTQPIVEINKEQLGLSRRGEEINLATPESIVFVFREGLPVQASYLAFLSLGLLQVGENALIQAGESFTGAIESLPQQAEASANPWEAYVWRGNVYSWLGEYDLAIADYSHCLKLNPHREGFFNRGVAYGSKGDHDAAIADYTKAIEIDTQYKDAYFNRGVTHGSRGDYDAAIADYTRAIEIDLQYKDAYFNRGVTHGSRGDYDAAIADYTKAIEIDTQYKEAYFNRGRTYWDTGDYDAAIADYTKVIEIDPQFKRAYLGRGVAYQRTGNHDAAIADYTRAIEIDPQYALIIRSCKFGHATSPSAVRAGSG
jgi:tetratricopeptide (TPR) repeat protein